MGYRKQRIGKMFLTSKDNNHIHAWSKYKEFTSVDHLHRHRVDVKRMLALQNKGHVHKLLKKEVELK